PPRGRDGGGTGGLDKRNVPFGVEVPLLQEIARDRIGRAPERPDGDRLALEVGGPIRVRGLESGGGAEIDVSAVRAVNAGAQLGALGLGKGIVLGAANEGEGLT